MSTLQVRVEQYLGTISDTAALTDQLTAGAKLVADALPVEKLEMYSVDLTDSGSGVAVAGYRPLGAHKSNYQALKIPKEDKARAADSNSIYYAGTRSPSWYIDTSKAYVLPGGGKVHAYAYPTALYSASSITGFPGEYEHGVVIYTAIQQCMDKLNTASDALNALSYTAPSAPSAPADFSLTAVAPTAPADFTLTATAPTPPDDASYSYSNASLGTYTATTIGSLGTEPTYTKPTTTFSLTNALTYIETDEDLEKGLAELNAQNSLLEQYGKDLYNELNEYNKELEIYKSTVEKAIKQAELDQQRLMMNADKTTDLNLQNAAQTLNAAIELYRTKLQKYASQIDSYGQEVNAEVQEYVQILNKFGASIQLYSQEVNAEVQEYAQLIDKYQASVNLYNNQVQNATATYQGNITKYTNEINHFKLLLDSLNAQFDKYMASIRGEA